MFPETFGALIKLSPSDSTAKYGLEMAISGKKIPEEARLDNLNKLMSHFGVSFVPPAVLSVFSHPFWMCRLIIGSILGRRGRGR